MIVSVYIYKGLDWKGVWKSLEQCIDTLSIVLILISTSSIFGYCLTTLHVPDLVANAIVGFSTNPIVIALLIDLILLFLGCIMDMAPIILIATPILLPIATSIGIDPVQFGIIMVLNCGIGLLTPPVGSVLFHRFRSQRCKNGTCRKGNTSILSVYDHCIIVTYIYSGSKPSASESYLAATADASL